MSAEQKLQVLGEAFGLVVAIFVLSVVIALLVMRWEDRR